MVAGSLDDESKEAGWVPSASIPGTNELASPVQSRYASSSIERSKVIKTREKLVARFRRLAGEYRARTECNSMPHIPRTICQIEPSLGHSGIDPQFGTVPLNLSSRGRLQSVRQCLQLYGYCETNLLISHRLD